MTSRDPRPWLVDIREAIAGVREAVGPASLADFRRTRPMRRAVERELEIISEASRRLPDPLKATEAEVPWREVAGIGNVLRHDYQHVADEIVWNVVERHLGSLGEAVDRMLARLGDDATG